MLKCRGGGQGTSPEPSNQPNASEELTQEHNCGAAKLFDARFSPPASDQQDLREHGVASSSSYSHQEDIGNVESFGDASDDNALDASKGVVDSEIQHDVVEPDGQCDAQRNSLIHNTRLEKKGITIYGLTHDRKGTQRTKEVEEVSWVPGPIRNY